MVNKWRSRFLRHRLEGLYDEPRPGAPRKVTDAEVEQVVIQTLESTPRGQTPWSTRRLAQASGLSRMTISRIWRAFGLQPHRPETFKLSPDPLLIEKVRDLVGLYMNPPDHLAVCGARIEDQPRHRSTAPPSSFLGIPPVLGSDRGQCARRTGSAHHHG